MTHYNIPQDIRLDDWNFCFGNEHIEAYGYFIKFLIEDEKVIENEMIDKLLCYLNNCSENFCKYTEVFYHYTLEEINNVIRKNSYSDFCYSIVHFYSAWVAFISKEYLKIEIDVNENMGDDNSELKKEFEKHNDTYSHYNDETLHTSFKLFFDAITSDTVKIYSDNIYKVITDYCRVFDEYTDQDILKKLIELKNTDLPIYKKHLIDQYICEYSEGCIDSLFESNKHEDIVELYNSISDDYLYKKDLFEQYYFEFAYSFSAVKNTDMAKYLYGNALEIGKNSSAIYNNLGVIYDKEGNEQKAITFFTKAYELDPNDEVAKRNKENTENSIEEKKKKEQKLRTTYFKKLQKYHKSILFTIHRYSDEVTEQVLHDIINQEKYVLRKNIKFLLDQEMLQQTSNGTYIINTVVEKWLDEYVNPTLERQIVKVDNSKLYRPIFYHESEINLYRVLIELFPQHFIFPNMSLKTIFDIDKLKELLEQNVLSYLFKAHVDFAIVNTGTYFPVLAFEKDSELNDKEPSKTNNEYKNQIFKTGGIPLIRLRYNSGMDYERLKKEVKDVTKDLILEIENGNSNSEFDLLKEIDKKKFGITNSSVDLKIIQKEWDTIVGSGIAIKSKVIDVENRNLIIEISNDLRAIIEIGKENINKRMLEKFAYIEEIIYNWY